MKRIYFIFIASLLFGAVACEVSIDDILPIEKECTLTIEAAMADNSRTTYDGDCLKGWWNSEDCLGVYASRLATADYETTIRNKQFTNSGADHSAKANFTTESVLNLREGDVVMGYYPYDPKSALSETSVVGDEISGVSVVRRFALGNQTQNGGNSTAHIGANDFLIATPVELTKSIISADEVRIPFTFTHAFAVAKFVLKNEYTAPFKVSKITINASAPLVGEYAIDILTSQVRLRGQGSNTLSLDIENCDKIDVGGSVNAFLMLGAETIASGAEIVVETSVGNFKMNTTQDFSFRRGYVTTITVALNSDRLEEQLDGRIADCYGSWRLDTYYGSKVDFSVYMVLNEDETFELYQRSGGLAPTKFTGTYTFDARTSQFSGRYSDGTAWATTYLLLDVNSNTLKWANVDDSAEISTYVREEVPDIMKPKSTSALKTTNVKRFL